MADRRVFHNAGNEIGAFARERFTATKHLTHELGFEGAGKLINKHPKILELVTAQRKAMHETGALYENRNGEQILVGKLDYHKLGLGPKIAEQLDVARRAHELAQRTEKLDNKWAAKERDVPSDWATAREEERAKWDHEGQGYRHP